MALLCEGLARQEGAGPAWGRLTVTVVPRPTWLWMSISPPKRDRLWRTMLSPRPLPTTAEALALPARKNSSPSRSRSSAGMPIPVSTTRTRVAPMRPAGKTTAAEPHAMCPTSTDGSRSAPGGQFRLGRLDMTNTGTLSHANG